MHEDGMAWRNPSSSWALRAFYQHSGACGMVTRAPRLIQVDQSTIGGIKFISTRSWEQ